MFTGLVQCLGTVTEVTRQSEGRRLSFRSSLSQADRALGASIAVNGVCLTVTAASEDRFSAFAAFETLSASTLGTLSAGDKVNLEPALRIGDPIGGHLVGGHVDAVGTLQECIPRGPSQEMRFVTPAKLLRLVAVKGSIAIDGVSLTVNAVDAATFSVGVIPHTLAATTLATIRPGARVNLEADMIARYVDRVCGGSGSVSGSGSGKDSSLSLSTLLSAGY